MSASPPFTVSHHEDDGVLSLAFHFRDKDQEIEISSNVMVHLITMSPRLIIEVRTLRGSNLFSDSAVVSSQYPTKILMMTRNVNPVIFMMTSCPQGNAIQRVDRLACDSAV